MTRPRWKQWKPEPWLYGPRCAFCGRDPYEYVDIGVGYQAVAVSCCEEGIALYHGDRELSRIARLLDGDKRRAARGRRLLQRYMDAQNDAVWLECTGCGKKECMSRRALENGDAWATSNEAAGEGQCGGSERCIP
jgi:hypothetical protein